jgi:Xaa-Pro aminopeptidase
MLKSKYQSFSDRLDPKVSRPRLEALRRSLGEHGLDGFLVPRADEHQGEYVPACDERLAWLTGFTGSAGIAVILPTEAALFGDGRYTLQIAAEVDTSLFRPVPSHEKPIHKWLETHAPKGLRLGYDPHLHTVGEIERIAKVLAKAEGKLIAAETNPLDAIWRDRPALPNAPITAHPFAFSGETVSSKILRIQERLLTENVDALLVSDPHNVAWALNIRGADLNHSPIALAYALIPASGHPTLFTAASRVSSEALDDLTGHVELAAPDELSVAIRQVARGNRTIRLDAGTAGIFLKTLIERAGGKVDMGLDPITAMKAIKNTVERAGSRAAHLRDGVAMARVLKWLDDEALRGALTEIDAVAKLERFRSDTNSLRDISFPTISGMGSNGAIVHYRVSEKSNRPLKRGLYLVDSGGQYQDGTTDITRTIAIGRPSAEMKDRFTRVLKGMIAVSRAQFPTGTTGAQIDTLARQYLWAIGCDYDHGTGHGVGSYLSVHEGPQRIAKTGVVALEPGMIISNEPGYYKTGRYGIRLENLVLVEERAIPGGERPSLGFETLTLAPIDRRLIVGSLLDKAERGWLNAYHARVLMAVGAFLDAETRTWLAAACAPL